MDWDDVRLFLAVAKSKTLTEASARLGMSHSTVSRRLAALESRSNVRLFKRTAAGYSTTEAGQALYESALDMEEKFLELTRKALAHDAPSRQVVRISAPDVLVHHLAVHLAEFRRREPHLLLELGADNSQVDLNRLEADLVLRASRLPHEHLVGVRVAQTAWAVYAARSAKLRGPDDERAAWIGYSGSLALLPVAEWMREHVPEERIILRTNSSVAAQEYARAGLAVACLWCLGGDRDPELVRLTPPLPDVASNLWLLTHPDLQRSRRIAKVRALLARALRADRDRIEGRAG
jgi:DNA-binding transcriptional LysR family regulator